MARIIIIHYGGIKTEGKYRTLVFYEGLIRTLTKNGNTVLEIITNDFLKRPWSGSNRLKSGIDKPALMDDMRRFRPDLIISFNNSSFEGLERIVSCPIAIWDADHFHHFNDIDTLKTNVGRYIFFCSQTSDLSDCQKILGASREQCHLVRPATSVEADANMKKSHNISFIGTPFVNHAEKEKLHRYKEKYVDLVKALIEEKESPEKLSEQFSFIPDVDQTILDFGSVAMRTGTLARIAPLGLNIHGGEGWLDIGLDSSLDIFAAYNPKRVYSLDQTQQMYNESKIGLNINHAQAKSGYSWRVMDILASSAVLVSNYSKDLAEELGDLSKDIFYDTPQEAYELCDRLLKNDALRERIVSRSNELVRKYHTWDVRIREIEEIVRVPLVRVASEEGRYAILDVARYYKAFSLGGIFRRNRHKKYFGSVARMVLLIASGLNGFGKRFFYSLPLQYLYRFVRFIMPYGLVKGIRLSRHVLNEHHETKE